jgi:hypothetical protein
MGETGLLAHFPDRATYPEKYVVSEIAATNKGYKGISTDLIAYFRLK